MGLTKAARLALGIRGGLAKQGEAVADACRDRNHAASGHGGDAALPAGGETDAAPGDGAAVRPRGRGGRHGDKEAREGKRVEIEATARCRTARTCDLRRKGLWADASQPRCSDSF